MCTLFIVALSTMDIYRQIYMYISMYNCMLFSREKEGNPAICENMDEP